MKNLNISRIALAFILLASAACGHNTPNAFINEVAVPIADDSDYWVTAVDGAPATRAASKHITVVPFVILRPGEHVLTVEKKGQRSSSRKITGKVLISKAARYRLQVKDDKISVVEEAP